MPLPTTITYTSRKKKRANRGVPTRTHDVKRLQSFKNLTCSRCKRLFKAACGLSVHQKANACLQSAGTASSNAGKVDHESFGEDLNDAETDSDDNPQKKAVSAGAFKTLEKWTSNRKMSANKMAKRQLAHEEGGDEEAHEVESSDSDDDSQMEDQSYRGGTRDVQKRFFCECGRNYGYSSAGHLRAHQNRRKCVGWTNSIARAETAVAAIQKISTYGNAASIADETSNHTKKTTSSTNNYRKKIAPFASNLPSARLSAEENADRKSPTGKTAKWHQTQVDGDDGMEGDERVAEDEGSHSSALSLAAPETDDESQTEGSVQGGTYNVQERFFCECGHNNAYSTRSNLSFHQKRKRCVGWTNSIASRDDAATGGKLPNNTRKTFPSATQAGSIKIVRETGYGDGQDRSEPIQDPILSLKDALARQEDYNERLRKQIKQLGLEHYPKECFLDDALQAWNSLAQWRDKAEQLLEQRLPVSEHRSFYGCGGSEADPVSINDSVFISFVMLERVMQGIIEDAWNSPYFAALDKFQVIGGFQHAFDFACAKQDGHLSVGNLLWRTVSSEVVWQHALNTWGVPMTAPSRSDFLLACLAGCLASDVRNAIEEALQSPQADGRRLVSEDNARMAGMVLASTLPPFIKTILSVRKRAQMSQIDPIPMMNTIVPSADNTINLAMFDDATPRWLRP